jgi:hypothetical protein
MNLHGTLRGAITSVNPDIAATWMRSTGNTVDANYHQVPAYKTLGPIRVQPQALRGTALQKAERMNWQGVLRTVYMYGNKQGLFRPEQMGGDLLLFPLVPNGPVLKWLIVDVPETWPDWCCVTVCLQQDIPT